MAENLECESPPQRACAPQRLDLDRVGPLAADDPEMTDCESIEAKIRYQENTRLREESWERSVRSIMLAGSIGYISNQLGAVDPRPTLSDADREQVMITCQSSTRVVSPADGDPVDGLSEACQDIFTKSFSAPVDSLHDAAKFLEIDPHTGRISDASELALRPDQIQTVAFMVKSGEGTLRGCVNANASGTGKTIEGLAAIYLLAKRSAQSPNPVYKPALILCPSAAMKSWQRDYNRYFRPRKLLRLHVHNGRGAGSTDEIQGELEQLNSLDCRTSTHVFLFSYTTFASRLMKAKDNELVLSQKKLAYSRSTLTVEQVEAFRTSEKVELFDLSLEAGRFGICIADEAHNIKDPKTKKAHTVYLANAHINFLLTAAPMPNRVSDMRGLLIALFRNQEWQLNWPGGWDEEDVCDVAFAEDFDPYSSVDGRCLVPVDAPDDYKQALRDGIQLWCLNPALYRWLGHRYNFKGPFTERVLALIFRTCVICRSRGDKVVSTDGTATSLADLQSIPKCTITTVEVGMSHEEHEYYQTLSASWFGSNGGSDTRNFESAARLVSRNQLPTAGFNKTMDWRLRCLTVSPGLAQVSRLRTTCSEVSLRDQVLDFDDWEQRNNDLGVSFYYHVTRQDDDAEDAPGDRRSMIAYMLNGSPKMRWLLTNLWRWKKNGEKVIIFVVHPLAQWLIERVCLLIGGFDFLSVTASLEFAAREEVFADFNDPTEHYDFLVVPMTIGGNSVELQNDCHRAVIFELPESFPTVLNAIGRINRVRQQRQLEVVVLVAASSYDDFTLARAFRKYTDELCGKEGFVKVATGISFAEEFEDLEEDKGVSAKEVLAGEFIRRKFGMQQNRLGVPVGQSQGLKAYRGEEYERVTRCGKILFEKLADGRK